MRAPTLTDDGRTVVLDVHGSRVDEAVALVGRAAAVAGRRGRLTLRVVHGHSTSDPRARNRTIRHALHAALDDGAYAGLVTGAVRFDGHLLLSLPLASRPNATPIRLADLR